MAKKKPKAPPAPLWTLGRVTRADAGGKLYNAIHVATGREHWGIPTHNEEMAARRVQYLNDIGQKFVRVKGFTPYELLDHIAFQFEDKKVAVDALRHIQNSLMDGGGYVPPDPFDVEDES